MHSFDNIIKEINCCLPLNCLLPFEVKRCFNVVVIFMCVCACVRNNFGTCVVWFVFSFFFFFPAFLFLNQKQTLLHFNFFHMCSSLRMQVYMHTQVFIYICTGLCKRKRKRKLGLARGDGKEKGGKRKGEKERMHERNSKNNICIKTTLDF